MHCRRCVQFFQQPGCLTQPLLSDQNAGEHDLLDKREITCSLRRLRGYRDHLLAVAHPLCGRLQLAFHEPQTRLPGSHLANDPGWHKGLSGDALHLANRRVRASQIPLGEQNSRQTEMAPADHGHVDAACDQRYPLLRLSQCSFQVARLGQYLTTDRQKQTHQSRLRQAAVPGKLHLLAADCQGLVQPALLPHRYGHLHAGQHDEVEVTRLLAYLQRLRPRFVGCLHVASEAMRIAPDNGRHAEPGRVRFGQECKRPACMVDDPRHVAAVGIHESPDRGRPALNLPPVHAGQTVWLVPRTAGHVLSGWTKGLLGHAKRAVSQRLLAADK